jgi:hypothetical protein
MVKTTGDDTVMATAGDDTVMATEKTVHIHQAAVVAMNAVKGFFWTSLLPPKTFQTDSFLPTSSMKASIRFRVFRTAHQTITLTATSSAHFFITFLFKLLSFSFVDSVVHYGFLDVFYVLAANPNVQPTMVTRS